MVYVCMFFFFFFFFFFLFFFFFFFFFFYNAYRDHQLINDLEQNDVPCGFMLRHVVYNNEVNTMKNEQSLQLQRYRRTPEYAQSSHCETSVQVS